VWNDWGTPGEPDNLLQKVGVKIYSDIPDPDGTGPLFSMPGDELWTQGFLPDQYTVRHYGQGDQGWIAPWFDAGYDNHNHVNYYQVNIENIENPFSQEKDNIYWLGVALNVAHGIGWKTSDNHFNDDAVYWNPTMTEWMELYDPVTGESLDMAFVITGIPEPATLTLTLLAGGAVVTMRRRRVRR